MNTDEDFMSIERLAKLVGSFTDSKKLRGALLARSFDHLVGCRRPLSGGEMPYMVSPECQQLAHCITLFCQKVGVDKCSLLANLATQFQKGRPKWANKPDELNFLELLKAF